MIEAGFTLALKGRWDDLTNELVDRLYESGCDDATVSYRAGRVMVAFDREAETVEAAVVSAIADVRAAGYDVERIAEGDAVGQAEMADRLGVSRQRVHALVRGVKGPGGFPAPISAEGPTWSWREVSAWLAAEGLADPAVAETARVLAAFEAALAYESARRDAPKLLRAATAAVR